MAVKKPIVMYGGLMKQIQPGDTTPGQHDASIALSYAKLAEGNLDTELNDLSTASSLCCASGRSVALRAESWAEAAESIARDLDISGHASYAYSLAHRAESVGREAEEFASYAMLQAIEAVELSDISEAHSVAVVGVEDASVAQFTADGAQSTGVRAESLAREASIAAGGGLDSYSEATELASLAYSNAIVGQFTDAIADTSEAYSLALKAEGDAASAQGTANTGVYDASVAASLARAAGANAGQDTTDLSLATSLGFSEADLGIAGADSVGTRAESLARAGKSSAIWYASDAVTDLSVGVAGQSLATSVAIGNGVGDYSIADSKATRAYSVAMDSQSEAVADEFTDVWASLAATDDSLEAYSVADSAATYTYSNAVAGQSVAVSDGIVDIWASMANVDEINSSLANLGISIAALAQKDAVSYVIDQGSIADRTGMVVYQTGTPGVVGLARADNEATMPGFGIIVHDSDETVKVKMSNDLVAGAKIDSSASPITGANLFVSTLQRGRLTNVAPAAGVTQRMGAATKAPVGDAVDVNFRVGEPIIM